MISVHRLHTVTLELLRHGPPHNQLLSKLTDYLALCGNLGAESVRVPFDHGEYLTRLQALSYEAGNDQRRAQLEELGQAMSNLLGAVPGLAPELSKATASHYDMTHLRLVITPHELALLPFECAYVPKGVSGGEGQRLVLQTAASVCITREVRGAFGGQITWPSRPRILYAWASPPGVGPVPFEQHLLELRKALKPWIDPYRGTGDRQKAREFILDRVKEHLTVLPNASIDDIYEACAVQSYTHVHILAHGIPTDDPSEKKLIGLALHDRADPTRMDVVDGGRLANALCFPDSKRSAQPELPVMVTVASCDSGRVRSVITHGASIAHDLHLAGIPVVIASQFPLSISGSIVMVHELYCRVLAAEDVRVALHHVRRRLFSLSKEWHDWSSLVAYTALPLDFESQIARNQYRVAKRRIDQQLDQADGLLDRAPLVRTDGTQFATNLSAEDAHKQLMSILEPLGGLAQELRLRGEDATESIGVQAATWKRKGEILYWASRFPHVFDSTQARLQRESLAALDQARRFYEEGMGKDLANHWFSTQYLSLTRILNAVGYIDVPFPEDLWTVASVAAENELKQGTQGEAWSHATLAELYLLRASTTMGPARDNDCTQALHHVHQLLDAVSRDSFEIYSTRRQFARYVDWFEQPMNPDNQTAHLDTGGLASQIVAMLPDRRMFVS